MSNQSNPEQVQGQPLGSSSLQHYRQYLAVMSPEAAVFVQFLMDFGQRSEDDGWVLCTRKSLLGQLFMSRRVQDRIICELKAKGFVQTRRSGLPAKRQIKLCESAIQTATTKALSVGISSVEVNTSILVGTLPYQPIGTQPTQSGPNGRNWTENAPQHTSKTPPPIPPFLIPPTPPLYQPPFTPHPCLLVGVVTASGTRISLLELPKRGRRGVARGEPEFLATTEKPSNSRIRADNTSTATNQDTAVSPEAAGPVPSDPKQATLVRDEAQPNNGRKRRGSSPTERPNRGEGSPLKQLSEKQSGEQMDTVQFPHSDKDKMTKTAVTPQDRQISLRLREFARRQFWPVDASDANWAQPIAILRRQMVRADPKGGSALLEAVVNWYVGWYAPGKKPRIRNGLELKQRWDWVYDLYRQEQEKALPVELPPDVTWVLDNLRMLVWPAGSDSQLEGVVYQSYRNYTSFLRRFLGTKVNRDLKVEWETVRAELCDPADYLAGWFRQVWHSVHNWQEWNGDMGRFVWRPDHKDFLRRVDTVLTKATGFSGQWKPLAAVIASQSAE